MRRTPKPPPSPDWLRRRRQHVALRRADAAGLQHLVEFQGKGPDGSLLFAVWSKTRDRRWLVRASDANEPLNCTCENAGICSHMAGVWLYLNPHVKEVKPLARAPRQRRPQDRDHSQDPESFAPEVGPIPAQYAGSKRTVALL